MQEAVLRLPVCGRVDVCCGLYRPPPARTPVPRERERGTERLNFLLGRFMTCGRQTTPSPHTGVLRLWSFWRSDGPTRRMAADRCAPGPPSAACLGLCWDQLTLGIICSQSLLCLKAPAALLFQTAFWSFRNAAWSSLSGEAGRRPPPRTAPLGQGRRAPPARPEQGLHLSLHVPPLLLPAWGLRRDTGISPSPVSPLPCFGRRLLREASPGAAKLSRGSPPHPGQGQTQALRIPVLGLIDD